MGGGGAARQRRGARRHLQRRGTALGLVGQRRIQRPLPARLHGLHQPLGVVGRQRRVRGRAQRQAAGHLAERGQVQPVGLEFALRGHAAFGPGPGQGDVAARPFLALGGAKLQVLGRELEAVGQPPARQAPGHGGQRQRLKPLAQRAAHARQRYIGGAANDVALAHIGPGAQGAPAGLNVQAQVGVAAQLCHVDPGKLRVELAVPVAPLPGALRQQRLAEQPAQAEAVTPFGRRRGVQPQRMAARAVARDEIHLAQRERRTATQFVRPAQRAAADHEFGLAEKPVGRAAVVAAVA